MKTLELDELPAGWQLNRLPDSRAEWIEVQLWFKRSEASLNKTWRDVAVRVVDPVDRKVFHKIASRERQPGYRATVACMPFWEVYGPRHLVKRPYVTYDRSPWRKIKAFGTLKDFFPALPNDRPAHGYLLRLWRGEQPEKWIAVCKVYHDYLTWRTYRAVHLLVSKIVEGRPYSETHWQLDLGQLKRSETWPEVEYHPLESDAPDLGERSEPYSGKDFYELVRQVYGWHFSKSRDHPDLGFEFPIEFNYFEPHEVVARMAEKPRLGFRPP